MRIKNEPLRPLRQPSRATQCQLLVLAFHITGPGIDPGTKSNINLTLMHVSSSLQPPRGNAVSLQRIPSTSLQQLLTIWRLVTVCMSIVHGQRLAALVISERVVTARPRVTRLAVTTTPAPRPRVPKASAKWISPSTSLPIDPYPCRAPLAPPRPSPPSKRLQRGTAALRHRFWHGVVILCTLYVSFGSSVQGRLGGQQNEHRGRTVAKSPLRRSRTGHPPTSSAVTGNLRLSVSKFASLNRRATAGNSSAEFRETRHNLWKQEWH